MLAFSLSFPSLFSGIPVLCTGYEESGKGMANLLWKFLLKLNTHGLMLLPVVTFRTGSADYCGFTNFSERHYNHRSGFYPGTVVTVNKLLSTHNVILENT